MDSKKKKNVVKEQSQSYNYDDYANLLDEGVRYELVDGTLEAMSPAPHPIHQSVCQEVSFQLKQTCQLEYITFVALIDVILSENEVRKPDIAMIHKSCVDLITNRGIEGSPDLVVEILSPSSIAENYNFWLNEKDEDYETKF